MTPTSAAGAAAGSTGSAGAGTAQPNETSPIRRTAADMQSLRGAILAVAEEIREGGTITLRQLYYALTVRGVLAKTEADYKRLAQITSAMRRGGDMPYQWIEDGTRITYAPTTYESAKAALEDLASRYLESPWADAEVAPEIWLEKDALAGVVYDVTYDYCVPLRVQRGYASLSALYKAARDIVTRTERGIATQVYYLRDLDPSGADAARAAEKTVRQMVAEMKGVVTGICEGPTGKLFDEIQLDMELELLPDFRILGVTPQQVKKWQLPTRPNKATDTRSAGFTHATSVELDAIEPKRLRKLVADAIAAHLPEAAKLAQEAQIESARAYLQGLAKATAG